MAKKILQGIFLFLLLGVNIAYPHPPTAMSISPDFENNILHIKIKHMTSNPCRYYIRRVDITVDSLPAVKKFYRCQKSTQGGYIYIDLPVDKLSQHKTVTVKAYPMQGVVKEKVFNLDDFKSQKH